MSKFILAPTPVRKFHECRAGLLANGVGVFHGLVVELAQHEIADSIQTTRRLLPLALHVLLNGLEKLV